MGKLDNKVAIITGGSGGIGRELAETARSIGEDKCAYMAADVTDADQVKGYIAATVERFGGVDVSLLNAGIEGKIALIQDQTEDDFDKVIAVNVRGVWLGLKYTMPEIAKRGGGSLVITSSTAGIRGVPRLAPYITSKHAVVGMMRAGAMEGAKDKIRVNTVNPSPIDTDMITRLEDTLNPARGNTQPMAEFTPLRRYGEPEEVARMMLFLGSEEGAFCTGGVYMVDGGVSAGRS